MHFPAMKDGNKRKGAEGRAGIVLKLLIKGLRGVGGFKYSLLPTSQDGEVTRPRSACKSGVISICYPDDVSGRVQKLHAVAEASRQPQFISDALSWRLAAQRMCLAVGQLPRSVPPQLSLAGAASRSHQPWPCRWGPRRGAAACLLALVSLGNVAPGVGGTASALPISVSARARLQIWQEEMKKR